MLSGERVFAVEGDEYGWRDVIVAAARCGDWANAQRRARLGAASVEHAATTGDALPAGTVENAGREFRYARDLVTAQSMEEWLKARGLTAKEWTAYLRRELCRARWPAESDTMAQRYPISDDVAARITLTDAICSGELDTWKRQLAGRAAAAKSLGGSVEARVTVPLPDILRPVLPLLGASIDDLRESAGRVEALEIAFERFREAQVTEAAIRDYVGRRQIEWVQFDCRMMGFPEEDMAAEAALLLREDGEGFTGVYAVARAEPRAARFFLDHIDGPERDVFLAARTGDLVGPLRLGNEYVLYLIRDKVLPSPRDPEVRRRAEEGVLNNALSQQLDRRVRWFADAR